jgi:pilus assembly protein Flp/PilA
LAYRLQSLAMPGVPPETNHPRGKSMKNLMLNLYIRTQNLKSRLTEEEGQDLVEYALVVALIALAATAGMNTLATDISAAFTSIGGTLNSAL